MDQLRENVEAFDVELSKQCLEDVEAAFRKWQDPSSLF
jgi:aryl-alcohol dehydrogenase-like predicted oxidoreductase